MSEKQDIASRLLGSESVASLRAEQEVVASFKARPWCVVLGLLILKDAPLPFVEIQSGESTMPEWPTHLRRMLAIAGSIARCRLLLGRFKCRTPASIRFDCRS